MRQEARRGYTVINQLSSPVNTALSTKSARHTSRWYHVHCYVLPFYHLSHVNYWATIFSFPQMTYFQDIFFSHNNRKQYATSVVNQLPTPTSRSSGPRCTIWHVTYSCPSTNHSQNVHLFCETFKLKHSSPANIKWYKNWKMESKTIFNTIESLEILLRIHR